jgi:hypothetical protein
MVDIEVRVKFQRHVEPAITADFDGRYVVVDVRERYEFLRGLVALVVNVAVDENGGSLGIGSGFLFTRERFTASVPNSVSRIRLTAEPFTEAGVTTGISMSKGGAAAVSGTEQEMELDEGPNVITVTGTVGENKVEYEITVDRREFDENAPTAPNITTGATLPAGETGKAYEAKLDASGTAPIAWTKTEGELPDGISLSSSGTLSGTPSKDGQFSFNVKAANWMGADEKTFSIDVGGASAANIPGKPKNLTAVPGSGTVLLVWEAPDDTGGSAITKYEAMIDGDGAWTSVMGTSYTFVGLAEGELYTFRVRAVNENGAGESAVATAIPGASEQPEAPSGEAANKAVNIAETPAFTPVQAGVEAGLGTKQPGVLDDLPISLAESGSFTVIDGVIVADVDAARNGLSRSDARTLDTGSMVPLPVVETAVSREGNTAVVTFRSELGGFVGKKLGDLAVLKLTRFGETMPLKNAQSLEKISDGQYTWTSLSGLAVPDDTVIVGGEPYALNIAIKDDGEFDWDLENSRRIADPAVLTIKRQSVTDEGEKDVTAGSSGSGGGGCDSGIGISALAALGCVIALRRRGR